MAEVFHNEEDLEEFQNQYHFVFFEIGQCLTKYQSIEDSLYDAFIATMPTSNMLSASIFELSNGIETKLKMIRAAAIDRGDIVSNLWLDLQPRIKKVADTRNQIAHSTPIQVGRGAFFRMNKDTGRHEFGGYLKKNSELHIHKKTKAGVKAFNLEELVQCRKGIDLVWLHLMTFLRVAQGLPIPAHFRDAWGHGSLKDWPVL